MTLKKINNRVMIYLILLIILVLISQISFQSFAREVLHAYICAAINGVFAVEIFFLLDRLKGMLFFKLFWPIYFLRLGVLVMFVFIYAILNRDVMISFFKSFLVYYFTWLHLEIIILMKVSDKNKKG